MLLTVTTTFRSGDERTQTSQLYCIVSIHLYSVYCSAHQSEALPIVPVRETQGEESSLERTKRGTCSGGSRILYLGANGVGIFVWGANGAGIFVWGLMGI